MQRYRKFRKYKNIHVPVFILQEYKNKTIPLCFKTWQMLQKNKQIVGSILVIIFAFYYANICFFTHSHIINGVTIVHSHFHNKAHTQSGTHSESELTLIAALSVLQSVKTALGFAGLGIFLVLLAIVSLVSIEKFVSTLAACRFLRAPPASLDI